MAETVAAGQVAAQSAAPATEDVPTWREALLPRAGGRYLGAVGAAAAAASTVLALSAPRAAVLPAAIGFGAWCAVIAAGDAVTKRIPNKANATALLSGIVLLAIAAGSPGQLGRAALGAAAAFAIYFVLWLIAPAGMGLGDVKLAPYLGAHLAFAGWDAFGAGLIYGFIAQAALVVVLLVTRRIGRRAHVPHGPAMCLGAIVSLAIALPSV